MEKYIKIITIITFTIGLLLTNLWGWGMLLAFIGAFVCSFLKSLKNFAILLPIAYFCTSTWATDAKIMFSLGLVILYAYRVIEGNDDWEKSKMWVFGCITTIGFIKFVPHVVIVPLLATVITLPIISLKKKTFSKRAVSFFTISCYIAITLCFAYCFWGYKSSVKRAYMNHGVWADASYPYEVDNLRNQSAYSYSEFVNILSADTISDFRKLKKYDELWLVTPTMPFTENELQLLNDWIKEGGRLIIESDHTDLYGHARCVNQIAKKYGCEVHYSATFDKRDIEVFNDAYGRKVNIKTGTNISGYMFPASTAWMWEEKAYYGNDNFFGPIACSGDDIYGEKVLMGIKGVGKGQICFFQESTIFSNFAVYEPNMSSLITTISSYSIIGRLYTVLPLILAIFVFMSYLEIKAYKFIFPLLILLSLPFRSDANLNYGSNPQIWTGNPEFVMENGCPYSNISTAYSLASLSNRKPLWIDNVDLEEDDVIYIDSIPPKNKNWRWIKVEDLHKKRIKSESVWDTVYSALSMPYINRKIKTDGFLTLETNGAFNDIVMNSWWYNGGITKNRINRINAWIAWLNKDTEKWEEIKPIIENTSVETNIFGKKIVPAILRIHKKEPIVIAIPQLLKDSGEIYLGEGVAAHIIKHDNKLSIFGLSQYGENWNYPKVWSIDYTEDTLGLRK